MFRNMTRGVLTAIAASTALATGSAQACWFTDCFKCFHCCKPAPAPVTYAPPAAPACEVCPQQVSYVQQTAYRTEYQCVPCTSYRPVTTCDPCTGCPQTVMRPVTTYVRRAVQVPYTTYRPVVTPAAAPVTGAAYSSPYYTGAVAAPGCSTCGTGSAVSGIAAPSYSATPAPASPGYGMPLTTPSLAPTPSATPSPATPGQTFQNGAPANGTPNTNSLRPEIPSSIPDMNHQHENGNNAAPSSAVPPLLSDPSNQTARRSSIIGASSFPAVFRATNRNAVKPISTSASQDAWSSLPARNDNWRPMGGR